MKPANAVMSMAMTALVVLPALALEWWVLGPLFQVLFLQANGMAFWTGLAVLCVPKGIAYGLLAYLGVRYLGRHGSVPAWAFVAVFGACWLVLRWGHNWPGPGWAGMLFTYAPLLIVPVSLIAGAILGRRRAVSRPIATGR